MCNPVFNIAFWVTDVNLLYSKYLLSYLSVSIYLQENATNKKS